MQTQQVQKPIHLRCTENQDQFVIEAFENTQIKGSITLLKQKRNHISYVILDQIPENISDNLAQQIIKEALMIAWETNHLFAISYCKNNALLKAGFKPTKNYKLLCIELCWNGLSYLNELDDINPHYSSNCIKINVNSG